MIDDTKYLKLRKQLVTVTALAKNKNLKTK